MAIDAFPSIGKEGLTADQRALWDEVTMGERGSMTGGADATQLPGLYNAWIHFPTFGLLMMKVGDEIRRHPEINGKLREMVVITTSALLNSRLEYDVHSVFAKIEGLPVDVIAAIGEGVRPDFSDNAERIVYDANLQLVRTGTLTDETRNEALDLLGRSGLIQLIALVGLYITVSHTINVCRIELPSDFSIDESAIRAFLERPRRG